MSEIKAGEKIIEGNKKHGMSPKKAAEVFASGHESNLRKIRISRGLSQQDLSDATKITKRLIQAYEQGYHDISNGKLDTICTLCIALRCTIEDIIDDIDTLEKYKRVK